MSDASGASGLAFPQVASWYRTWAPPPGLPQGPKLPRIGAALGADERFLGEEPRGFGRDPAPGASGQKHTSRQEFTRRFLRARAPTFQRKAPAAVSSVVAVVSPCHL
jgi:hypothetical protein